MSFYEQYKSSLKVKEAEELIDLYLFRPLGFLFVKLIYNTNITPNQVSILSMIFGVMSGVLISMASTESVILGGLALGLSNTFDCADGQLARFKQNGTLFGRLLDGVLDYISTISVFLGIGVWGTKVHIWDNDLNWWLFVVVTGITYAYQAGVVDYYRSEYIHNHKGKVNFVEEELKNFENIYQEVVKKGDQPVNEYLLRLYIKYTKLQLNPVKIAKTNKIASDDYVKRNQTIVRIWNLNGTSMHNIVLIGLCFVFKLDWYIWFILVIGNLFTAIVWMYQRKIDNELLKKYNQ